MDKNKLYRNTNTFITTETLFMSSYSDTLDRTWTKNLLYQVL